MAQSEGDSGIIDVFTSGRRGLDLKDDSLSNLILRLNGAMDGYHSHIATMNDQNNPYPTDNPEKSREDYWKQHVVPIKEEIDRREKEYLKKI